MDKKNKLAETLNRLNAALDTRKLFNYRPYPWQVIMHKNGAEFAERMLSAGNRCGKTYSAAHEVAFHATGLYPENWPGHRFKNPINVICAGKTAESVRDIMQKELLGGQGEDFGTGALPKTMLGKPTTRQAGIGGVVDQVKVVWHADSNLENPAKRKSTIQFKSYEQGWAKFQGTAPDFIWLDEEPDDYKIFTECRTRLITKKGRMLITFTPLSGRTDLVEHFEQNDGTTSIVQYAGWDDCPHLDKEEMKEWLAGYPEWEREARSKGIPMLGEGRVFPVPEDTITCDAFAIPDHFAQIIGIDFGSDHPAACVKIAYDRDNDTIYVVDAHKQRNMDALQHSQHIKSMGGNRDDAVPVSWPHDGVNRDKGNSIPLYKNYIEHGVTMLGKTARYNNDTGGNQPTEPVIMEIYERMTTGRFRVFRHLTQWFEEFRNYHRKDGLLVRKKDDILSATFYAVMMKRYAKPRVSQTKSRAPSRPMMTTRY